jgi:hypothetical protein
MPEYFSWLPLSEQVLKACDIRVVLVLRYGKTQIALSEALEGPNEYKQQDGKSDIEVIQGSFYLFSDPCITLWSNSKR